MQGQIGEQNHADQKKKEIGRGKIAVAKQGRSDEGLVAGKNVNHEQIESQSGQDRLGDDFARGEPVQQLTPVQHQLQRCHSQAERGETEKIESQIRGSPRPGQRQIEPGQGQRADRQIDVENPAPAVIIGQKPPQRGSHDWSQGYADAPDRHCTAVIFGIVNFEKNGLRKRHQGGAPDALKDTKQHQASGKEVARPHKAEAAIKPTTEIRNMLRRP